MTIATYSQYATVGDHYEKLACGESPRAEAIEVKMLVWKRAPRVPAIIQKLVLL